MHCCKPRLHALVNQHVAEVQCMAAVVVQHHHSCHRAGMITMKKAIYGSISVHGALIGGPLTPLWVACHSALLYKLWACITGIKL